MKKLLLWGLPAAALAAILFLYLRHAPDPRTRERIQPSPVSTTTENTSTELTRFTATADTAAAPLRYRFQPGEILTSSFESFRSVLQRSTIDPARLAPPGDRPTEPSKTAVASLDLLFRGTMELRPYETKDGLFTVGLLLRDPLVQTTLPPQLQGADPEKPGTFRVAEIEKLLREDETVIRMSERGRIESVGFPDSWNAEVRNIVRSLLCDLQMQFATELDTTWTIDETDSLGRCTAAYRREEGRDGSGKPSCRLIRTPGKYRSITLHGPARAGMSVEKLENKSSTTALFDPAEGRIQTLSHENRFHLRLSSEFEIESTGYTRYRLLSVTTGSPIGRAPARRFRSGLAAEGLASTAEDRERSRFQKRIAEEKLSTASLLARREDLAKRVDPASGELARLFQDLTDLVRYDDSQISEARRRLLPAAKRSDAECQFIVDALGQAGTPTAQKNLGEIIGEETLSRETRTGAIIAAASMTKPPLPEIESILLRTARADSDPWVQATAMEGVGVIASQASERGEESKTKELVKILAENQGIRKDNGWTILWLASLGNTHSPEAYPLIEKELAHNDPAIAAQAAESLGFLKDDRVDPRLGQLLATPETREEVALGAVKGLEQRKTPEAKRLLEASAEKNPRESVRKLSTLAAKRIPASPPPSSIPVTFSEERE